MGNSLAYSIQLIIRVVWKFCLPIPEHFLANETIRAKLQLIAEGKGDIPLFVAADMNNDSKNEDVQFIPRLRANDEHVVLIEVFSAYHLFFWILSLLHSSNIQYMYFEKHLAYQYFTLVDVITNNFNQSPT